MRFKGQDDEDPAHILWFPVDELLNDPVIGLNVRRRKDPVDAPCTPFIAFQMLNMAAYTRQDIDEWRKPNPIILYLDGPPSAVDDMAVEWRWRPSQAKRFVRDIEGCGLIDGALATALLAKIGSTRRRQKRPPIPKTTRAAILAKTGGKCTYCGIVLTMIRDKPNSFHVDHLLAVRDGATNDPALLVPACGDCNQKKGAKTLTEFIAMKDAVEKTEDKADTANVKTLD